MLYLAPVFLLVIAYLLGELFSACIKDNLSNLAEKTLLGTFILLCSYEGFVLVTQKLDASFRVMSILFTIFLLIIILLCSIFVSKRMYNNLAVKNPIDINPVLMILAVFFAQVICFFILSPDITGDYTVETVNTTIMSDSIYKIHPGTGLPYQNEYSLRGRIVALPIFYAYVENLFRGNVPCLIYRAIPIWSLALSFICYGLWALYLFKKDEGKTVKISIFLAVLAILNICGMFSKNCIFYNQMFRGFRGGTICFSVIIPYCVYCLMYMMSNKNHSKWINIVLAVLCSITLTDYQKGFVPTVIAIFGCCLILLINRIGRWIKCRQ